MMVVTTNRRYRSNAELDKELLRRDAVAQIEWRKTNAKKIDAAVKLLGLKSRDDVETALIEIKFTHRQLVTGFADETKPAKLAARNLAQALERVQRLTKNKNLPIHLKMFHGDVIAEWLASCREIAFTCSGKHPQKEAELKRLTVREAVALMAKHNMPSSNLVKLATILYGNPNVNLSSQCAAYIREARKVK
jgi:hypothetical protein